MLVRKLLKIELDLWNRIAFRHFFLEKVRDYDKLILLILVSVAWKSTNLHLYTIRMWIQLIFYALFLEKYPTYWFSVVL